MSSPSSQPITFKQVFALAWPASVASMITPLLGLTDATVLGYSARPLDIGAVGLAGAIFSLAYWTFGFLRMSTAGLTAQAVGEGNEAKARRVLAQSVGIAAIVGLTLVILQGPFGTFGFWLMTGESTVEAATISAAKDYYAIRIWGAPFALITYGMLGWLTARGRTDLLMAIACAVTFLNMALDVLFVMGFQLGAAGVATGTLIAEIFGLFATLGAVAHVLHKHGGLGAHWQQIDYVARASLKRLLLINMDIFIRTLILVAAFVIFIRQSAVYGDLILSANQLLIQFFLLTGLALDGAAIAAETLVGQSLGQKKEELRRARFGEAVRKSSLLAAAGVGVAVLIYLLFSTPLLNLTAPDDAINRTAQTYFFWVVISPIVVGTAFQLDGIYIGATRSAALRNSMIVSGFFFAIGLYLLMPFGNHGLWAAFSLFMIARAITLGIGWRGFEKLLKEGLHVD
jgi:MATE family multidrug resistance protein